MDERRILSVSELNSSIRSLLEGRFPFVSVAGELSNLHKPYSGHCYFTLKDAGAQIKAVLFKLQQRYLERMPKDGDHVVCRGRISVYEPRGDYQLIVDAVDFHGAGALQQAFEQLKRRLAAEGLFDEHLKRSLPRFPTHITLVTSPQGAAVHDFIRIAARRCPMVQIAVYPVTVQGDQAAAEMVQALAEINARVSTDVIVLCRGGGSLEDLWAFNDEALARAIRASGLPVVSAVGHEIDLTIADFAADLRAPTPSAAAELLTPDGEALRREIDRHGSRLQRILRNRIDRIEQRLRLTKHRLETMPHPLDRLLLRLDHLTGRMELALKTTLADQGRRLDQASFALARRNPAHRLQLHDQHLKELHTCLAHAIRLHVQVKQEQFGRAAGVLHAVSPLATLARGYAIVRKNEGRKRIVTEAAQVQTGETVAVTLHHGALVCRVEQASGSEGGIAERDAQSRTASNS
ncbi:exodeoxyribonuclease VII large subunit [Desulfobulbus sp.]|uniref:exodeoxyribonuclease VII large subunit n=1 Tax=Desulfobulbus sp. TaxID=895 RepID=UPI0027B8D663|nr:exodeoxyribonuclease VII large subunit [Desulfobulbus sp.]